MAEPARTVVETEVHDGIGVIHLNRPHRLNAVNAALVEQLVGALEAVTGADVGAVLLAGRGRAFCAGHDLKAAEDPATLPARLDRIQDVTRRIRACPAPVIAAVHGHAIGAGAEFALGCDLVIAATGTTFRFPEAGLGLTGTGGIARLLPLLVGPLKAKELLLLGDPVDAEEAARWGLVNAVVPGEELATTAHNWARRLAEAPRAATQAAKRAVDHGVDHALETVLRMEVEHALRVDGGK
nr:enoyl-CoA hydratase/isomerase family protein [Pseudonocardia acaciae]